MTKFCVQDLTENPELLTDDTVSSIQMELNSMGYKMKDLKLMDHHDIDQKVWDALVK